MELLFQAVCRALERADGLPQLLVRGNQRFDGELAPLLAGDERFPLALQLVPRREDLGHRGLERRHTLFHPGEHRAACLVRLEADQREVFELRALDGLEFNAIARLRRIPLGTAKSTYYRSVGKLRRALAGFGDDVGHAA